MAGACSVASGPDFPALARQLFGNVRLSFAGEPNQSKRLASAALGSVRVSDLRAGPHTVQGEHVVKATHDPDCLKLLFQSDGSSTIEQGGRQVEFGRARPVLYDPTRAYTLVNQTRVHLLMLQVPREAFSRSAIQSLSSPVLIPRAFSGLCRVVRSMIDSGLSEVDHLDDASRTGMGDGLIGLIRPLIEGGLARSEMTGAHSLNLLLYRARMFIDDNLDQPDLTVEQIAIRMGCSQSYLFRAFQTEGLSPAQYIWDRRLERARAVLTSPVARHRSVTDIAFAAGFTSGAHFSRAFRSRFGMTPRDFRRAALG
ncbi:helix-turn-helix domain-containing protein [Rhizobium alvei]|uniref:Helix-turn-helix domain-containing protein n=1 Tax=Rhizobium alvei TaxID=1132659 RepID=A0ABT8YQC4_9HYPH|nr:helix-turn-helix domain-containing protein [Rhizobium alvei]MDO6965907.1 helix-turn-helix domain-containing protein [Rhizobium alvei]